MKWSQLILTHFSLVILVNIDLGNGLLPDDRQSLSKPVLTCCQLDKKNQNKTVVTDLNSSQYIWRYPITFFLFGD